MEITNLNDIKHYKTLFEADINDRRIDIFHISNGTPTGKSLYYPNVLIYSKDSNELTMPINEITMSLKDLSNDTSFDYSFTDNKTTIDTPVFFFVYNTGNYYHFIYDTLPYLISYFRLKEEIPNLKLLINYPNEQRKKHYLFVMEFLELLGITQDDFEYINENKAYSDIFISTSYTHDGKPNIEPRMEVYELYRLIVTKAMDLSPAKPTPKKIYISRRTWLNKDNDNIGTNYTTKRSLTNETELVELLVSNGYTEVFTENLSTVEKIQLFNNATDIIGAIGGGLCNVLFSKKDTRLIALISPTFLDVNYRFIYSLNKVELTIFGYSTLAESTYFKKYMRVKYKDIVGEIVNIEDDKLTIMYSDIPVSGWANDGEYKTITVEASECSKLDNGLNCAWTLNLQILKNYVN